MKKMLHIKTSADVITFFLTSLSELQRNSQLEVLLTFYPLNPRIDAEEFRFEPYEDYVTELAAGRKSTYRMLQSYSDKIFGIFLSLIITAGFWLLLPGSLSSVEAIVAILGAYAIGKEFWLDFDRFLQKATRSLSWQWSGQEYSYVREDFGTIQRFWQLARQQRYGYTLILPREFDLISHSNSKTIEMFFDKHDLAQMQKNQVRILTVERDGGNTLPLSLAQVLLSCRVRMSKKVVIGKVMTEYYQGLNHKDSGTIDSQTAWLSDTVLIKHFWILGRLRFHFKSEMKEQQLFSLS